MESDSRYLNAVKKHVGRSPFQHKLNLFLLCLVIAIVLWFVIKYSKDYQVTIPFKISLHNFPENYIPQLSGDSIIHVGVNAQGFTLLYYSVFKKDHLLSLDAGNLNLKQVRSDVGILKLSLPWLKQKIENSLPKGMKLKDLSPNIIRIHWEKADSKKIPIIVNYSANYAPNYQIYGEPVIFPDSIWIKGNRRQLRRINSISTISVHFHNLNSTVYTLIPLDFKYTNDIKVLTHNVLLKAEIIKFTEQELEVPVSYDSTLNKRDYRIFPDKVKLRYLISLKDYKNITPSQFKVTVSQEKTNNPLQNKLKVNLILHPENIRNIRIEPEKVEFIQLH